ncbi:ATP-binding protein [Chitinophaga horti]|uniref:histidine kinase n=1 Tax=Chitinophaga horti TaxID=2920382 RepID=A0ABY6IZF2_9BACT|nr:sensor histidine kinase [Chitinophaga horti]UYQ91454.1 ATP-binding protein [Chitinophaga horti]
MRYALLYILLFCMAGTARSQPVYFRHYQVEDGLPNNTVFAVLQDSKGFMWFGTKEGLSRFDGSAFKAFNMAQNNGLNTREFVYCIGEGIRNTLWIGTRKGVYEFDPRTETFTARAPAQKGEVLDIITDGKGKVWFTADLRLNCYDERNERITSYLPNLRIAAISMGEDGTIWAGAIDGAILRYEADSFRCVNPGNTTLRDMNALYAAATGEILVGTIRGLTAFDPATGHYRPLLGKKPVYVRDILHFSGNEYWIASESGIHSINLANGTIQLLQQQDSDPYSLSDNAAYTLYRDREGGTWCGTYFGGLNYYHQQHSYFRKYFRTSTSNSLSGHAVREICADGHGNLWIGTEDAGLNKLNTSSGEITRYPYPTAVSSTNIHALLADGNELWVGTFQQGLDVLDIRTGKRLRHYNADPAGNGLKSNFIISACKTESGDLLFGTSHGIYRYERTSGRFVPAPGFPEHCYVFSLYEDQDGCLWAGTIGNGLYYYHPKKGTKGNFRYDASGKGISSNSICGLFEDSQQQLWISTEGGGLCRLDKDRRQFSRFNTSSGLPSDMVYKVLEDPQHRLWISTSQGLVVHDPAAESWKVYSKSHGLLTDQFNYNAGYSDSSGTLFFGSVKGLISFRPASLLPDTGSPPVHITSLQLNNREFDQLPYAISFADTVRINYDQSSFAIGFAALTYIAADMTTYAYRLDGLERNWTYLPTNRKVYFTDLSPGDYLFRVRTGWDQRETRLLIRILPPWWLSFPAYFAYGACTLLLIYFLIRTYHRRQRERHQRKMAIFEQQKEKEIYKAKIEFFTNVAHEIRTPLTLIKGPLEMVIDELGEHPGVKKSLQNIERNTARLVALTDQLLDFRQTEHQDFRLSFVEADIPLTVQKNVQAFAVAAQQKSLAFELQLPAQHFSAFIDMEAFHKIIDNLIGNALKYAGSQVLVTVEEPGEQGNFVIRVMNDGALIPWQLREKIFEPFFRIHSMEQPGSGIGLPLARALTQLHSGHLQLREPVNGMNIFELTLPVHQEIEFTLNAVQSK